MFVEATTPVCNLSPFFALNSGSYKNHGVRGSVNVKCMANSRASVVETSDAVRVNGVGVSSSGRVDRVDRGELFRFDDVEKEEKLEPLWDDGYGTQSVKDYLDLAKEMVKGDGGPPRWFCPVGLNGNDRPLPDSPVLLFLPGMDGLGLGLILHQKSLGKVFEVRCLHIPVHDRTPFRDLVRFVEETVRLEHASTPSRPIYLVGDSFGGCLALAVAAHNPTIDLVLILANPATSFGRSQLQPLLPFLELLPDALHVTVPYLLSFVMGDPVKMATVGAQRDNTPDLSQLSGNLVSLLPRLSGLSDIIPKSTLIWKLRLLRTAAGYANSRLHAVKAEVLVLASGKDNMLPSRDEAQRLSRILPNCEICHFKDNGHTILLEDGLNLLTVIKGTQKYRRSWKHDFVRDYLPPSMSEYKRGIEVNWWLTFATSPVMFSTLEDGSIVRGLAGVPDDGPVLFVGYHMLLGLELAPLILEFLREKKVIVRGVAHPALFAMQSDSQLHEFSYFDLMKVFGALPVTPSNLFKLLSTQSFALLYPGGAREALHRKGEEYKLFWPDQPEFVRMAARFGATIVPFGVVGEDDILELVLDYDDVMRIPVLNDYIRKRNEEAIRLRTEMDGEVANQRFYFPGVLPKVPGRFYYLFGKPISTKGKTELLEDRKSVTDLYFHVKAEVERCMAYLVKKREDDPYRWIVPRMVDQPISTPVEKVPSFEA